ncbi:MAG: poly-gamma-glutamate synthase PgsB [Candidatus Marinimicrobia bacterium]|nr:poly-gamma-glutamate synthase PgsB [Candidatus Neomarinimicrobiota bacterium]
MIISPLFFLGTIVLILILIGYLERVNHQHVISNIPLRIHVNGTRGKSSVTRLIAAGLRAGGMRTLAKTTGTAPRIIDSKGKDRIIHRLRSASIGEQIKLMRLFSKEKPDAIVMECMAVQPEYQWISEHQMIQSHVGVITNARPDHLEEMGPTIDDVKKSLGNTIPQNGKVVFGEKNIVDSVSDVAELRNTKYFVADEDAISDTQLAGFPYIEHPQNIAVALKVCNELGVKEDIALNGMQNSQPDPGALVINNIDFGKGKIHFINSMAANDPVSTLQIWNIIKSKFTSNNYYSIYLNCREDRRSRTHQLLELIYNEINPQKAIIRGKKIEALVNRMVSFSPNTITHIVQEDEPIQSSIDQFKKLPSESILFAIGNQVGFGQDLINALMEFKSND